jgi:hypothetical protein
MVQEETVVESETRIVECERLTLVWGGGNDNLSDTHILQVGTCPRPRPPVNTWFRVTSKTRRRYLLFAR